MVPASAWHIRDDIHIGHNKGEHQGRTPLSGINANTVAEDKRPSPVICETIWVPFDK